MGMAASQARYLSLSARKTNTEYEGQQINQQRLNLANQSADLFNQMLTMSVPTCPDSNDFTKIQYSWSDGINDSVISNYYQLGTANEDYNYVVESYHYEDVYTGGMKKLNDPKVNANKTNHFTKNEDKTYTVNQLTYHPETKAGAADDSYTIVVERNGVESTKTFRRSEQLNNNDTVEELDSIWNRKSSTIADKDNSVFTPGDPGAIPPTVDKWSITNAEIPNPAYNPTDPASPKTITVASLDFTKADMDDPDVVSALKQTYGAKFDASKEYFAATNGGKTYYIVGEDAEKAHDSQGEAAYIDVRQEDKTVYYTDGTSYLTADELASIDLHATTPVNTLDFHSATNAPTFDNFTAIGNCELLEVTEKDIAEDEAIETELKQIIKDMKTSSSTAYANLSACFDENTGEYLGGIYSFKMNGVKYYTTNADLTTAAASAYKENPIATNGIDGQDKLSYYKATYINTKIDETKKALLETDGKGRFKTVKFEDDSVVYTLNCETITDEKAYNDAMNQYYYKQEQYDKRVADINAKTEIIQAEDRELELRLEQLGTEQTALQTEMEACQKVVSKNVESGFKTFGG